MFVFTVGKLMTFYSKTLSLSHPSPMSMKIKYPNGTPADQTIHS